MIKSPTLIFLSLFFIITNCYKLSSQELKKENKSIIQRNNIFEKNETLSSGSRNVLTVLSNNGSTDTNGRAPQGSRLYVNTCYIIRPSEMVASGFGSDTVKSVGWTWNASRSQNITTKGTLNVYILNTTDTAYNKGTNFTTAISGMTKIIDDSIAVLSGLGPFTINVPVGGPGTSSFVTTSGQGVYIAFEYKTTSTLATPSGSPTISCNNSLTNRGGTYQSQSANGTTLTLSAFAPETILGNSILDSVEVKVLYCLGGIPSTFACNDTLGIRVKKNIAGAYTIQVKVKVKNIDSPFNVVDSTFIPLTATGPFDTLLYYKIPCIPVVAGGIIFQRERIIVEALSGYLDDKKNNLSVTVYDSRENCQYTTYDYYNYKDPCETDDGGIGINNSSGNIVARFNNYSSNVFPVVAVEHSFYNSTGGGSQPYKIVIYGDNGSGKPGSLLYSSSTLTSPSGTGSAQTVSHTLTSIVNIAANSRFYVGIRQNSSTNVGFGFQNEIPVRSKSFFYSYPDTSNTWTDFSAAGANYKLDIAPLTGEKVIITSSTGTTFARYASLDLALAQVGVLHTGVVKVLINESHTLTASATIGNSNFTSCKIFPTAAVTITSAINASMILLSTADNVTIDGRLNGVDVIGNGNSLTLTSTNIGTGVRCIQTQNGSQNTTIRNVNCNVPVIVTAAGGGRCINIGQSTSIAQGGQDNVTVQYCNMSGGDRTFQTFGSAGFAANSNQTIFGNKVRNSSSLGIFIGSDVLNVTCDSNEIYDDVPVYKGGAAGVSSRGIGMQAIGTVLVQRNRIHDLTDNGIRATGMSLQGIISIPFRSAAPLATPVTTVTIQNNFVLLAQNNIKLTSIYGIYVTNLASPSGLDHNARVYNNTSLVGGTGTLVEFTYGYIFWVPSAVSANAPSTATFYNNVSMNLREAAATSQHVGMDLEPEVGVTTLSDYNTCYADGLTGVHFDATDAAFGYTSTFGWRNANCALGLEQSSAMHPVNYDANYQITANNYGDLNGKTGAGIPTTDMFGVTKAGTYPYRGAVEGPALKVLTVTMGLEGRTGADPSNVIVALYDGTCTFVDYACGYITDTDNSPKFIFSTAVANGTAYSLQCLTATHIVSWSAGTSTFTAGAGSYVFNSAASIFGSNGTASGEFFAADVNQDETVDAGDLGLIDNDATLGVFACRLNTDVTYDGGADASDLAIADGNSSVGIFSANKCAPSTSVSKLISMNKENGKVKLSSEVKPGLKNEIGF